MADGVALPPKGDSRWRDLATGKINRAWNALAMKILIARILRETSSDPSISNIQRCADELYLFFEKNMMVAKQDLSLIVR